MAWLNELPVVTKQNLQLHENNSDNRMKILTIKIKKKILSMILELITSIGWGKAKVEHKITINKHFNILIAKKIICVQCKPTTHK